VDSIDAGICPTPPPDGLERHDPGPLLAAFVAQLGVNAWIKDSEGRYLFVNRDTERRFSPTRGMVGLTDFDLFSAAVAESLRTHDCQVLDTGLPLDSVEEVPVAGGETRCWYAVKFPVRQGGAVHVGGVAVDITTYARLEQEKRQAQEKFHQILDAIADLIFVKGPESRLEWGNRAFRDAYGMTVEQIRGLIDAPFNKPDYTLAYVRDDQKVWNSGQTLDIPEEPVTRHDGKVMLCHTVKSPIFDAGGQVINIVGVCRDITEKKRMELELRQAQKLESVGRLASGIAHEINTPIQFVGDHNRFTAEAVGDLMTLVSAYRRFAAQVAQSGAYGPELAALQVAEEEADLAYLEDALPRAFAAINEGTSRVAKLVAAMKEFGHPDRGMASSADINRALATTITIAGSQLKHVARVHTAFAADLPHVRCVISDLNQVFLNLLVNAAHAIADAGRAGHGGIRVSTCREGESVVVSIADDGTGIPPAVQARMYEPFFTTKEVGRGTGQGLAIARMLVVEKHGGRLTFETEEGRGTTFHVAIPIDGLPPATD
jgi:two-component system, NtrC family, sensor kinase